MPFMPDLKALSLKSCVQLRCDSKHDLDNIWGSLYKKEVKGWKTNNARQSFRGYIECRRLTGKSIFVRFVVLNSWKGN